MSIMVIILSITFIIFTSPQAILVGYLQQILMKTPGLFAFLIVVLNQITMTYHSFNSFILYLTNKQFKREIGFMFHNEARIGTIHTTRDTHLTKKTEPLD